MIIEFIKMKEFLPMNISYVSLKTCEYSLKRFPDAMITILHSITGLLYAQGPHNDLFHADAFCTHKH